MEESNQKEEILKWLREEYTEEKIKQFKAEQVYEYVDEEEAEEYDGDYEEAYDNYCTGEAIEWDLVSEMDGAVKEKFGDISQDRELKAAVEEEIYNLIRLVFPVFGAPSINEISAQRVNELMERMSQIDKEWKM